MPDDEGQFSVCDAVGHDVRIVSWRERGTVRRANGVTEPYEFTFRARRCVRCEPADDITNDPIIHPTAGQQAGGAA